MLDGEPERERDDRPVCVACHLCERMHGETSGQALVSGVVIAMLVSILHSGLPWIVVLQGMMQSLCDDHTDMFRAVANLHQEPKS